METDRLNILVLDDDEQIRKMIKRFLGKKPYIISEAGLPQEAFELLKKNKIDLMLLDVRLPEMSGIEVLKKVKTEFPDVEVIIITGSDDMETVKEAMKLGAFDFFYKPVSLVEIESSIERTGKYISLYNKYQKIENNYQLIIKELGKEAGNIIGASSAIKTVLDLTYKAAQSRDTSVLITGESGTGKELIARAIHYSGSRKDAYFFSLNCSAIPETLIESELFGHVKGAFTGAFENKKGCFETADGGTLFLDEIGDMPFTAQTKLLRSFEEKKIKKIGSNTETSVDVRIISATNKNLEKSVEENKFRLDLFYRLNAFLINIPPLRERREDIPLLIDYYIKYYSGKLKKNIASINRDAAEYLGNYDFPGNVRELKNIIERAIILTENNIISLDQFQLRTPKQNTDYAIQNDLFQKLDLAEIEKKAIKTALEKEKNNKVKAAKVLNISRQALDRKIKKYNLF